MTDSISLTPDTAQLANIHSISVPEAFSVLSSEPSGLSQDEAEKRLQRYGSNIITTEKGKPLWIRFLANFTHLMAILLWVGGVVGFLAQMPQIGIAIWMVNIINGAFSFWQEFKAEKATEALRKLLPSYARVLRNGEIQRILAEELVPGDVILVEEGDKISADARLSDENELRVDQSTLSGESHPVRKPARLSHGRPDTPRAAQFNLCRDDSCRWDSERSCLRPEWRQNWQDASCRLGGRLSPLQKEMGRVTKVVTILATSIGAFFFILGILVAGLIWLSFISPWA
jgi:magnesium-transporting ATPase (P-type)